MIECNEYQAAVDRRWEPYSLGHRIMYDAPIKLMGGQKNSVLEVGCGIGYGLDEMCRAGVTKSYLGFEPCLDSFNYISNKYASNYEIKLLNSFFTGTEEVFDYVFCIEVIEHVEPENRNKMLVDLFKATGKALFLSTPDRERDAHGVYTAAELKAALKAVGFADVVVLREQWTDLYICTRV